MKALICCAAALMLQSAAALAAEKTTLEPNNLTIAAKRPPLPLSDQQRNEIQAALATENTEQKTPPNFAAKVGDTMPRTMKLDVMPPRLVQRDPALKQYGYAKLAKQVLVIDPMKKTIIAILPRAEPTAGKDPAPADWAAKRGRELTGQAPLPSANDKAPEAAGDSGDTANGTESTAKEK